ncbi:MAG: LysR family transcriptional regulator [Lachnospiraceae bacterium]|nr:LysR family transcriptional regulator [Lachnospiraceae bacterium]
MDLKAIKYVSEIVRCGSMTKAAEELYLSQSALSQYIGKLEESLDTRIFERTGGRLRLTRAGEVFVREGASIMSTYDTMCEHIRIATKEAVDGCVFEPFLYEEIMVAVPKDSPANGFSFDAGTDDGFKSIRLSDLSGYPFIMMKKTQTFSSLGYNYCAAAGFTPIVACELMSWDAINKMIGHGLGAGFVPRELALAEKGGDSPEYYHFESPLYHKRPFAIAKKEDSCLTEPVIHVMETVKEIAGSEDFVFLRQ